MAVQSGARSARGWGGLIGAPAALSMAFAHGAGAPIARGLAG
jgi:hypothetical protein